MAEKVGLEAPLLDICINLASALHDKNYIEDGYNLDKLGISEMSRDEIIEYATTMERTAEAY
ncbi:hypothetical protein QBE52_05300 [Clostridiaceae bacterium 35-E11]